MGRSIRDPLTQYGVRGFAFLKRPLLFWVFPTLIAGIILFTIFWVAGGKRLYDPEAYDKKYHPKEYWTGYWEKRIGVLEAEIARNEELVRIYPLEIAKLRLNTASKLAEAKIDAGIAKVQGVEDALRMIHESYIEAVQRDARTGERVYEQEIIKAQKNLERGKQELAYAKAELEKWRMSTTGEIRGRRNEAIPTKEERR